MNNRFIDSVLKDNKRYIFTLIPGNIKITMDSTKVVSLSTVVEYMDQVYSSTEYTIGLAFHDNQILQHWS